MKRIILFISIALISTIAFAQEKPLVKFYADKAQSSITYSMHHPLHSWTGVSTDLNSVILSDQNKNVISQVAVSVKISSFDSQNANRDSHAMEVTDAIKYPSITFTSTSIKQNGDKLEVTGILKFHNVSKTISFEAKREMIRNKVRITGGFNVTMTEFNIDPPSLMGIATDDEIGITFSVVY